jgi:hypothetical protein
MTTRIQTNNQKYIDILKSACDEGQLSLVVDREKIPYVISKFVDAIGWDFIYGPEGGFEPGTVFDLGVSYEFVKPVVYLKKEYNEWDDSYKYTCVLCGL